MQAAGEVARTGPGSPELQPELGGGDAALRFGSDGFRVVTLGTELTAREFLPA